MKFGIKEKWHATFLVAGTCIGGGMLAQPVAVAHNGFWPSCLAMLICGLFMTATALLVLEASSRLPEDSHFVSMAQHYLSKPGKCLAWLFYTFIAYASLIAYVAASADLLDYLLNTFCHFDLSHTSCIGIISAIGTVLLVFGNKIMARFNTFFVLALIAIYIWILCFGVNHMDLQRLHYFNFNKLEHTFGLFLAAFSFQMIVPSLRQYLKSDYEGVRQSICFGMLLTAVIYAIWLAFIFGVIPLEGEKGLWVASDRQLPITVPLMQTLSHPSLVIMISGFSLFALLTSFIGISLGLYEFLEDGMGWTQKKWSKPALVALVMVPTVFFALSFEGLFVTALDLTGGYGDTVLNGLMPVAMVIVGAYIWKKPSPYRVKFRRIILTFTALFASYAIMIESVKFF